MAFAAPGAELRRPVLMWSGIVSLLVFLTGFGMLGVLKLGFPGWAIVKIFCWLTLSAAAGIAFRKREHTRQILGVTVAALVLAVVMVTLKPF